MKIIFLIVISYFNLNLCANEIDYSLCLEAINCGNQGRCNGLNSAREYLKKNPNITPDEKSYIEFKHDNGNEIQSNGFIIYSEKKPFVVKKIITGCNKSASRKIKKNNLNEITECEYDIDVDYLVKENKHSCVVKTIKNNSLNLNTTRKNGKDQSDKFLSSFLNNKPTLVHDNYLCHGLTGLFEDQLVKDFVPTECERNFCQYFSHKNTNYIVNEYLSDNQRSKGSDILARFIRFKPNGLSQLLDSKADVESFETWNQQLNKIKNKSIGNKDSESLRLYDLNLNYHFEDNNLKTLIFLLENPTYFQIMELGCDSNDPDDINKLENNLCSILNIKDKKNFLEELQTKLNIAYEDINKEIYLSKNKTYLSSIEDEFFSCNSDFPKNSHLKTFEECEKILNEESGPEVKADKIARLYLKNQQEQPYHLNQKLIEKIKVYLKDKININLEDLDFNKWRNNLVNKDYEKCISHIYSGTLSKSIFN